jgi:1-acyl-sn-glycerol-3-phosphate acyltransferase
MAILRITFLSFFILPSYWLATKLFPVGFRRMVSGWFSWIVLKWLGFYLVTLENTSKKFKVSTPTKQPENGDLIMCNHISWLDFLILEWQYAPQFCYLGPKGKVLVIRDVFDGVFNISQNEKRGQCEDGLISLVEFVALCRKYRLGPIVLFAEGGTSNGKAVMPFDLQPRDVQMTNCFISTIKYSGNIPAYISGSMERSIFDVADNFFNYATLKVFPMENVLSMLEPLVNSSEEQPFHHQQTEVASDLSPLQSCIAFLGRMKCIRIGIKEKLAFSEFLSK